ncbi:MAG: hypothetical protein HS114_14770 [Anaerolineales bacterium]|nr:hypothetical protein [Anaerolineales bacterium]
MRDESYFHPSSFRPHPFQMWYTTCTATPLGSTSLTTNQSGALVSQARYLPYGEERWTNGASPTDFAFTSQKKDGFGLYDYNARY